ncbi:MAG: carbohydrate binding family 9 domain-containing protein [Acidobacteria bacterium]|nr:carbohydrate binding family 9 domain-containing protein [Acidobacteriota bacterium]
MSGFLEVTLLRGSVRRIPVVLGLLIGMVPVFAAGEKAIQAQWTDHPISVDGILKEEQWALAEPVSDFVQSEPHEGQPATERTEVRVLFDRVNLYVGVYCYQSSDKIIISALKRDTGSSDSDAFGVVIDPFHDRRNSFAFFTNPGSFQEDLQGLSDGREYDHNWDGIWYVASAVRRDGWSCEIAIPFKTLGFASKSDPIMGINFKRRIRHKNEVIYWSLVPRRFVAARVSLAGVLEGLGEAQGGRNLRVKPFVTADFSQHRSAKDATDKLGAEAGVDIKYRITQGLALDVTYNTDFSQVEVDAQQINLTRFSLFFPEKRDFFLENAGMFAFGDVPRERGNSSEETQLFYSRRIGLSPAGAPLPILGGVRLSGRAGAYAIGLLNIQQSASEDVSSNNFTVARVSRDLFANSDLGVLFINREGGKPGDYNRAYGMNLNLQFSQKFTFNSFMVGTRSPQLRDKNLETKMSGKWDNGFWSTQVIFADIGENFRPEVGFVPRAGVKNYQYNFDLRPRTRGNAYIREFHPNMTIKYFTDRHNLTLTRENHYQFQVLFRDGGQFNVSYNPEFERLQAPFQIRTGVTIPAGDYFFQDYRLEYDSDRSRSLFGSAKLARGSFYDGHKTSTSFSATLSMRPHFSSEARYEHNFVEISAGKFRADLYSLRFGYSFNPRMFVDAFIQYNTSTGKILTNLRFDLMHRPLSNISVVFIEDRLAGLGTDLSRAFIFKYTHLLQF